MKGLTGLVWLFWLALTNALAAQTFVRGHVIDSIGGGPVAGARVTAAIGLRAAATDRFGQFVIRVDAFPETLRVAFIGKRPAVVPLANAPAEPLRIALAAAPAVF